MTDEQMIDEVVDESFPASDPPSWTTTHAGTPIHARPRPSRRELCDRLRRDVVFLAAELGERNDRATIPYAHLGAAADHVARGLATCGRPVERHGFGDVRIVENLEVEIPGSARSEIVVVGAHYDAAGGGPCVDDNASGVAILIALARALSDAPLSRTVRLVAFANEEFSHTHTPTMGSMVYASRLHAEHARVAAMLSLETLGFFDLVAFVGNLASRALVERSVRAFRSATAMPARGVALPAWLPGVRSSDQRSFWTNGYPAVMVTDTAPLRRRHHRASDTAEKLDYERMADVVDGLASVVIELSRA